MKPMTVAEAIKFLSQFPSETKLVTSGSDHSYDPIRFSDAVAEVQYKNNQVQYIWEYYDQHNMTDEKNKVERVIVVAI